MEIEETSDGAQKAGTRERQATNYAHGPRFDVFAVRDNDAGTSWHGEVEIEGHVILATESVSNDSQATHAAEKMLVQRFVHAFAE